MKKTCETCRYWIESLKPKSEQIMDCLKKKNPIMNVGKCKTWKKQHNPEIAKLAKELKKNYKEMGELII